MRKVAVLFVLAVVVPSLVLAALALRSLRDQRLVQERQETLVAEAEAAELARAVEAEIDRTLREFASVVDRLATNGNPSVVPMFDDELRRDWPAASVGFVVNLAGECFSPSPAGRPEARRFRIENDRFLGNVESVQVLWDSPKGKINLTELDKGPRTKSPAVFASSPDAASRGSARNFREIIGNSRDGTVARFVQDELELLLWHRSPREPTVVFGARMDPPLLRRRAGKTIETSRPAEGYAAVLRDDSLQVVAATGPAPGSGRRRPLAAADIGDKLPHWHVEVFAADPGHVGAATRTTTLAIALLVMVLLLAMGVGSWLIAADLGRQLRLARQKAGFVSNVSHELRTPLTSIRMFADLLAGDAGADPERRGRFLRIIQAESDRLSRLVQNVLDFGRLERGDLPWKPVRLDLAETVREAAECHRPQLEAAGIELGLGIPEVPVPVLGDRDALAQVVSNLLSNVGKYAASGKSAQLAVRDDGGDAVLEVSDRGPGIPAGCEERVFEEFFRAHDSLAAGVPGCGLGLALTRRIVSAHRGTIRALPRDGGGAVFIVRIPRLRSFP